MLHRILALTFALAACRGHGDDAATHASTTVAAPPPPAPSPSAPSATPPAAPAASTAPASTAWSFDADPAGTPPRGFSFGRTGDGRDGRWLVRAEPGSPSGANVLAQVDADPTDNRFPVAWADAPSLRDVDLSVRCKPISGRIDQACGLVFRLRDANDYLLTRANALENNVRFYFVKGGTRQQVATWSGKVTANAWHAYRVTMHGDHVSIFWDGTKVIDARDTTFPEAGKVGVWTKADSVTYFDDLVVTPL